MSKKKRSGNWAGTLIYIVMGVLCGLLSILYLENIHAGEELMDNYLLYWFILMALIYLALFAQIIIHELGHLVCGLLTHYRFASFRVGSVMLLKENGRFALKRLGLPGTMGQCLMEPPELVEGKIPVVWYNMGGVFFNLLSAAVFGALFFISRAIPFLALFFLFASIAGLFNAFMNGVPMRFNMVANDGYNLFCIYKHPNAPRAFWIQLKAARETAGGARMKDMPEEWFFMPGKDELRNNICSVVGVFYANRLMDEHDFLKAGPVISRLLDSDAEINGVYRGLLKCDRVYCELMGAGSSEVINEIMDEEQREFMRRMKNGLSVIRTQYALKLLWEGDALGAEKYKAEFERFAARYPYSGDAQSEKELLLLAGQAALEGGENGEGYGMNV